MKPHFILYAVLILYIFTGCREKEKLNAESYDKNRQINRINPDQLKAVIGTRNGKLLMINVWATWCKPCVEEFPDLVKIAKDYKEKNLEFISLNVDFGKKADSLASDFLARQDNPDFPVYIIPEKSAEQIIGLLNKKWDGSIPATFIYDTEARQKSFILGAKDYDYFKKNIDTLMNMKSL